jgi:hypothetical protein
MPLPLLVCMSSRLLPVLILPLLLLLAVLVKVGLSGAPAQTVLHVSMMVLMLPPGTILRWGGGTRPPQLSTHRDSRSGGWLLEATRGQHCVGGALNGRGSGSISETDGLGELGMLSEPSRGQPTFACCRIVRFTFGEDRLLCSFAWLFAFLSAFNGTEAGRANSGPSRQRGLEQC